MAGGPVTSTTGKVSVYRALGRQATVAGGPVTSMTDKVNVYRALGRQAGDGGRRASYQHDR